MRMKKPLLILLLFLLALVPAACAVENFGTIEANNQAGRVLIVTGEEAGDREAYAAAQALSARYGRYLLHRELAAETLADPRLYAAAVLQAVAETKAGALILAPAYAGAAAACGETPILTIALCPEEEAPLIAAAADLVADADDTAAGAMAVAQAVEFGATAFVYYRGGQADDGEALLERTKAAALQAGLDFIVEELPRGDLAAGLDSSLGRLIALSGARPAISGSNSGAEEDDCAPETAAAGSLAVFSDDAGAEEELIAAALRHGCICPPQPSLTPYGAYGRVFGIAEPGDLYGGLSQYLKLLNRELVTARKLSGRFAAWRRPLMFVEADAAAEYAFLWLAGRTQDQGEAAWFRQCLLNANAKTISTYDREGAAYANYWLHLINIRVFDESG